MQIQLHHHISLFSDRRYAKQGKNGLFVKVSLHHPVLLGMITFCYQEIRVL